MQPLHEFGGPFVLVESVLDCVASYMARLPEDAFSWEVRVFFGFVECAVSIHDCTADLKALVG